MRQTRFIQRLETQIRIELGQVGLDCGKFLICGIRPTILHSALFNKFGKDIQRLERNRFGNFNCYFRLFVLPIKRLFQLFRSRHGISYLEFLEGILNFRIVTQQIGIYFRCALFEFIRAAEFHALFSSIPFYRIDSIAGSKLDPLTIIYDTHADRNIFRNNNPGLPAFL